MICGTVLFSEAYLRYPTHCKKSRVNAAEINNYRLSKIVHINAGFRGQPTTFLGQ
jgi:hypothetical protein